VSQEVAEGRTGVRTAAFPLADDIVAFCDQFRRTPEFEIGERSAEIGHECLDVVTAAARLVQGILQEHIWRGEFVDNAEIAGLAPDRPGLGGRIGVLISDFTAGRVGHRCVSSAVALLCWRSSHVRRSCKSVLQRTAGPYRTCCRWPTTSNDWGEANRCDASAVIAVDDLDLVEC
jgi:hypothetical protein